MFRMGKVSEIVWSGARVCGGILALNAGAGIVEAKTGTTAEEARPANLQVEDVKRDEPYKMGWCYDSVVKIEAATLEPDYSAPWTLGSFSGGTGTGFIIGKNQFLTNAHVVSNAQQLYIIRSGDPKKYPAKVKYIAHDSDLALLEVEDFGPFAQSPVMELDGLPKLEDAVRVIGYPVGGDRLSVTRGVVSRIDFRPYSHSGIDSHLVVQIDAAINPGNSGGPVMLGDKVVGVAFQGLRNADNTGYMIPMPVVKRFLKDIADGKYDGYVDLGISEFPIYNPAMRKQLGLSDDGMGILVADVTRGSVTDGVLKPGDVLLAIDGSPVDSAGMVEMGGQRVNMNELTERKLAGETVKLEWLRDGKVSSREIKVMPLRAAELLRAAYEKKPRYVVSGGLVFQPLSRDVILAYNLATPAMLGELEDFVQKGGWTKNEDRVVLTRVLADEINSGMPNFTGGIVEKVDGVEVTGLKDLHAKLSQREGGEFVVIQFKDGTRPLILRRAELVDANKRIRKNYQINRDANL